MRAAAEQPDEVAAAKRRAALEAHRLAKIDRQTAEARAELAARALPVDVRQLVEGIGR